MGSLPGASSLVHTYLVYTYHPKVHPLTLTTLVPTLVLTLVSTLVHTYLVYTYHPKVQPLTLTLSLTLTLTYLVYTYHPKARHLI